MFRINDTGKVFGDEIHSLLKTTIDDREITLTMKPANFFSREISLIRLTKIEQYRVMRYYDIPTVETMEVKNPMVNLYRMAYKYDSDVVLKPMMGAGSRGVYILSIDDIKYLGSINIYKDDIRSIAWHSSDDKDNVLEREKNEGYQPHELLRKNMSIVQPKIDITREYRVIIPITGDRVIIKDREYFKSSNKVHDMEIKDIGGLETSEPVLYDIVRKFRIFMEKYFVPVLAIDVAITDKENGIELPIYNVLEFSGQFGYSKGLTKDGFNLLMDMHQNSLGYLVEKIEGIYDE